MKRLLIALSLLACAGAHAQEAIYLFCSGRVDDAKKKAPEVWANNVTITNGFVSWAAMHQPVESSPTAFTHYSRFGDGGTLWISISRETGEFDAFAKNVNNQQVWRINAQCDRTNKPPATKF